MGAMPGSLTEPQRMLLRATEPGEMAPLDEDALLALHARVRRARDKYVGIYRRTASERVAAVGGRGNARPKNRRNFDRAEVFEDALARVSRRLATVARQNAAKIRAERVAAARNERATDPPRSARAGNAGTGRSQVPRRGVVTGATRRQWAADQAAGAKRQAKKDNR